MLAIRRERQTGWTNAKGEPEEWYKVGDARRAESYFRFITTPGIEPTNNLAEQAIRFVVIDRRITQ